MASSIKLPATLRFQSSFHDALSAQYSRHPPRVKEIARKSHGSASTTNSSLPYATLIEHASTDRAPVERFISQCLAKNYDCLLGAFMPRLFSVQNREGRLIGAFGLRSGTSRFYLEQYLDASIEEIIQSITQKPVERKSIVEVGNFSGSIPGSMRTMMLLLAEHLNNEGFEWIAFTGTAALRNSLKRLGLLPFIFDVREATAEKLSPIKQANWGSYYTHAPRVAFGNVRQSYASLLGQGIAR